MEKSEFYEKQLDSQRLFTGKIVNVRGDRVELANGSSSYREIVEHPGGVVILAVDEAQRVYLVRQYRYAVSEELLEVPAGKLERGEDPLCGAVRELKEETGLAAEKLVSLGFIYPSPGFCDEKLHLYLALGLTQGEACPDEDKLLRTVTMPLEEAAAMALRGEMADGKSVAAIFMAKEYLAKNGL